MRKEIVLALGLSLMLVGVLVTQSKLRESVKSEPEQSLPKSDETPTAAARSSTLTGEADIAANREVDPQVEQPSVVIDESTSVPGQKAESARAPSAHTSIQSSFQLARTIFQQKEAIAKSSAEELHRTPKQTVAAAEQLGNIVELEEKYPGEAASFQDFYIECARDEKVITVIRSQCLDRYAKLAKLDKDQQGQLLRQFPPEIVRLFEALQ